MNPLNTLLISATIIILATIFYKQSMISNLTSVISNVFGKDSQEVVDQEPIPLKGSLSSAPADNAEEPKEVGGEKKDFIKPRGEGDFGLGKGMNSQYKSSTISDFPTLPDNAPETFKFIARGCARQCARQKRLLQLLIVWIAYRLYVKKPMNPFK